MAEGSGELLRYFWRRPIRSITIAQRSVPDRYLTRWFYLFSISEFWVTLEQEPKIGRTRSSLGSQNFFQRPLCQAI